MTWKVHLSDHADYVLRNRLAVLIYRELGDGRVEHVLRDGSRFVSGPGEAVSVKDVGFEIPYDALEGFREAIDTLERERTRHDDLVDRIAGFALDPHTTELTIGHLARVANFDHGRPPRTRDPEHRPPVYTDEEPF